MKAFYMFDRVALCPTSSPFLLNSTVKKHVTKFMNPENETMFKKFLRDRYDLYDTATSMNSAPDTGDFYRIAEDVMTKVMTMIMNLDEYFAKIILEIK